MNILLGGISYCLYSLKEVFQLGWSRSASLGRRSLWIFSVISILMLILWAGWLSAVGEEGVCTPRTLKRSHFLYLLLCRVGFPANQNLENRIPRGCDASGQESLSKSHPVWLKPFLFSNNFAEFCLFCLGFIFVNPCCNWKLIVIFAAEQLKLENFSFQFLIIMSGKKCRKAARLWAAHLNTCSVSVCALLCFSHTVCEPSIPAVYKVLDI